MQEIKAKCPVRDDSCSFIPYYDSIIDENHKSDLVEVQMSDLIVDLVKTLTIQSMVKKSGAQAN